MFFAGPPVTFSGALFSGQSRSSSWARLVAVTSLRVQQRQAGRRCSLIFPSRDTELGQSISVDDADTDANTETQVGQGVRQL
jgi:hypothetical protein